MISKLEIMLAVEFQAMVIFTHTAYCFMQSNCNKSIAWTEVPCPPPFAQLRCLSRAGQQIAIYKNNKVALFCNKRTPDIRTIECANIINMNTLEMRQCQLSKFNMKTFLAGKTPKNVTIIGNGKDIFKLDVQFYNLPQLETLILAKVRTGGSFSLKLEALNSLKSLEIINNDFSQFPQKPFEHLQSLRMFIFQEGKITTFPEHLLDNLINLHHLNLRFSEITEIRLGAFKHLKSLKTLDLSHNRIKNLEPKLFEGLSEIISLDVSYNHLSILPLDMFTFLPDLLDLKFDGNRDIVNFPRGFFAGAGQLSYFSASFCGLKKIDQDLFREPNTVQRRTQLTRFQKLLRKETSLISASENGRNYKHAAVSNASLNYPFSKQQMYQQSHPRLKSLISLNISHNQISEIKDKALEPLIKLITLDASYNPLKDFPQEMPFGSSNNIKRVFLSNCQLSTIPRDIFSKYALRVIDLSNNQIIKVTLPVYSRSKKLSVKLRHNQIRNILLNFTMIAINMPSYYIEGNPLDCDCELEDFLRFVHSYSNRSNQVFSDANEVKCSFPNNTLTLPEVWPNHLNCKIKNCPNLCQCSKPSRDEIEVNCANKGLVTAPNILPQGTTVLHLENNSISTLKNPDHKSWITLAKLFLSNNSLTSLKSWTNISQNLFTLAIDNNELSDLPLSVQNIVTSTTEFRISLSGNKWVCECKAYSLIRWMKRYHDRIVDFENMNCETAGSNITVLVIPMKEVDENTFCGNNSSSVDINVNTELFISLIAIVVASVLSLLFVFFYLKRYSILAVLYARNIYKLKQTQTDLQFDSFILHDATDRKLVQKIYNAAKSKYKFCIYGRTKVPVEDKSRKIAYGMKNSQTTMLIVSQIFIESTLFQIHFQTVYRESYIANRNRFILIFVGKVDTNFLSKDLQHLLSGDRRIKSEEKIFWEKLRFFMGPPTKKIRPYHGKQQKNSLQKTTKIKTHEKVKKKRSARKTR